MLVPSECKMKDNKEQWMTRVEINGQIYRVEDWDPAPWAIIKLGIPQCGLKFPIRDFSWSGRREFMKNLAHLQEKIAYEYTVTESDHAPYDHSRFEAGLFLGNTKFVSEDVIWNGDLLKYYVDKKNVKPSQEFIDFVNGKELASTLNDLPVPFTVATCHFV